MSRLTGSIVRAEHRSALERGEANFVDRLCECHPQSDLEICFLRRSHLRSLNMHPGYVSGIDIPCTTLHHSVVKPFLHGAMSHAHQLRQNRSISPTISTLPGRTQSLRGCADAS